MRAWKGLLCPKTGHIRSVKWIGIIETGWRYFSCGTCTTFNHDGEALTPEGWHLGFERNLNLEGFEPHQEKVAREAGGFDWCDGLFRRHESETGH